MEKQFFNLTNPQNSIWLTNQMYPNTPIGNICGTVFIDEKVDFSILEKSINTFVQKNDSFRIILEHTDNTIKQYVSDFVPFTLEKRKIKSEEDVSAIEKELVSCPFSLTGSLLFKFVAFELPDGTGGFIMNAHHLIVDAWTVGITLNGIIEHYEFFTGKREEVPEKYPSYVDYINSEKEYVDSEKYNKDKEYWENTFKTIPEVAEIPGSTHIVQDSFEAKRMEFNFPKDRVYKIGNFCKANKASIFTFFMALYGIYISRVSDLQEFNVGTPILNRINFNEKNTTGMFVSTLPFSYNIKNDLSFVEYLSNIAISSMGMLRHQKYPYSHLLSNLRKKDSSIPNLYNILISYQNIRSNRQTAKIKYHTKWIFNNCLIDSLNIHIYDTDDTGSLDIAYDYKTSVYTESDILMIHQRILHLIDQIIQSPNVKLNDLEIITQNEKEKLIHSFNNTKYEYPNDKTIVELFENQVDKTPDNVAIVFGNKALTYRELDTKANSLAYYLRSQGISRNSIVGIMVSRSLEMIIAILAVMKSGACYIPIDPEYPQSRIEYMLKDSGAKLLLTFKSLNQKVPFSNKLFIELESDLYNNSNERLDNINEPEDMSYVIYTSGSTGVPKGVALSHKALSNLTHYCNDTVKYLNDDIYHTIVSVTTISFDIFIFETIISLQKGLKLIIANENEQLLPRLLNELIEKNGVEIIQTTPSRMQLLVNNLSDIPNLSKLKYITLAGEQLPESLVKSLKEICNPTIYNGYGPSETTIFSTLTDVTNQTTITIGKPLYNTQIYILGQNKSLSPINTPGELYIAGDGVGLGYLNNTELTRKSFLPNLFNNNSFMYKTGDWGYYQPNGEIICLGRKDSQIKIRGLRIELDEIKEKIVQIDGITNCIVVKSVLEDSHEFLCAYYTANNTITGDSIRQSLRSSLPDYMIPQYYILLDSLPYTPNGKIDKNKLPKPDISDNSYDIIPPRNDTDLKLINIISDYVGISNVNINASFFDLGGDSLTAINLCSRIYNEFHVEIFVKDIYNHPLIRELSDLILERSPSNTYKIEKAATQESYPLSSAQKRIYYASMMYGERNTLYNVSGGLLLDSIPNVAKLEESFNEVISKQASLRTYFVTTENDVVQKIQDQVQFSIDVDEVDLDSLHLDQVFKNFIKPFDLSMAPLLRAKLFKLNDGKVLLAVDTHHIISDGTSLSILINSVCKTYNGESICEPQIDYKDYAIWECSSINNNSFNDAENYWLDLLSGDLPVLNMPSKKLEHSRSYKGDVVSGQIDSELVNKINKLSKEFRVTPYMIMLSVYYILLYKYTSQTDIIVGTPIINRNFPELHDIIGMFVNSLPLRTNIDSSLAFKDFLNNIRTISLESFTYQYYPIDNIMKKINQSTNGKNSSVFDTMFVFQNEIYPSISFGNIKSDYYIPRSNVSKFDFTIEVTPQPDKFNILFEYNIELFTKDYVQGLLNHYINILKEVLNNVDLTIANIVMISDTEKDEILALSQGVSKPSYPLNKSIIQLFEDQVLLTPNKTAIVFENTKLSYMQLNKKASIFALYLLEHNIKKNDIVAIMCERNADIIAYILSVLKLGATYILIDPTLPKDHIQFVLNSSNANGLIIDKEYDILFKNFIFTNNVDYSNEAPQQLVSEKSDNNVFSIIYTSGSTGTPKGVMLKNDGFINLVYSFCDLMEIDKYKNHLGLSAVSFDMFAVEVFSSILLGRTLYLLNEEEMKNPVLISKKIIENEIEFLITTPSKMNLLTSTDEIALCLKHLKAFQLGGEVFTNSLLNKLRKFTSAKIYNGYGPTEASACCSNEFINADAISIGKPNPNTSIYILDNDLNLCPIGIPGEICVSGVAVSAGYINDAKKTSASFVNSKFNNELLYKTGDLALYNTNGELEYIGRNDLQVKINGLRIEPSGIVSHLATFDGIKSCAVIPDKSQKYLKAFVVSETPINVPEIKRKLGEKLPNYMIPKYIFQIDHIPLTNNGKIDTKYLNNFKESECDSNLLYTPPETDLQKEICSIWSQILETKVGIDNDLFDLGADSLLAINFKVQALNIGIDIPYADIFKYKTIRKIADSISDNSYSAPIDSYDYTNIDNVLEQNKFKFNYNIDYSNHNNVLLLGSNGYVGMHIINSFIKHDTGTIYCLMRFKNEEDVLSRFLKVLHFYFGNELDTYVENRIKVIEGDVTKPDFGLNSRDIQLITDNVSTIINSAANVKHFGNFEKFKDINIGTIVNAVKYCKAHSKRFIHLSTLSVSGNMLMDGSVSNNQNKSITYFSEKNLFINQVIDNVYIRSKYEAEKIILSEIPNGLDAQILRLGNITSRYSDGHFQYNPSDNAFANRLQTFLNIKAIPRSLLSQEIEFTPVDLCSNAIITCMQYKPKNISVLHIYNKKHIKAKKIIKLLHKYGVTIKIMKNDDFSAYIENILSDKASQKSISNIINDIEKNKTISYKSNIHIKSNMSVNYLSKCKFRWPKINDIYMKKYIDYMKKINFLNF
ncbi:MAG: amino acid adenylation domain-containing protein [Clostridia bacterium]|nr:amino acid adenylation domain-containing protein [Clostridia bacterium]